MSTGAAQPIPPEAEWAGWVPSIVCQEIHQLHHDGRMYWLRIDIRAELTGEEPHPMFPRRADLGSRIREMVKADCEAS